MLSQSVQAAIEQIGKDRTHGARWLTHRAAELLLELARSGGTGELCQVCDALAAAQPAMAPVVRLAQEAARASTAETLEQLCQETLERLEHTGQRLVEHALSVIAPGATVLTHSHSSTVESVLLAAHGRGVRFRLIATESCPLGEGRRLAKNLVRAGIETTLIADAAVTTWLPQSSLVLTGADAVSPRGIVNKIGTAAIAQSAKECGIPCYVLCTSDKLVRVHEFHDPEHLYDLTSLSLITGVITEEGLLSPHQIEQ